MPFALTDSPPLELATQLGERGFFTWDGNYYAISVTEHFDVEKSGGFLRIGLVHYNTTTKSMASFGVARNRRTIDSHKHDSPGCNPGLQ